MSLISTGIGAAKKIKHKFQNEIKAMTPVYISPVRRISGVKTDQRVCAMTFDDGPCRLAPNPKNYDGPLTMCLVETLEKHGARGSFDCVGDTSANYPDVCGKIGTAMWGGTAYDHYPDFDMDNLAGAKNCPDLIDRIISGGHEITNHTYVHRIWGAKPLVYGQRKHMEGLDDVVSDLRRFHDLLKDKHGYEVKLSRPPHYVDNISKGITSYDAYALMGYQYMAAGPDGGGWLPGENYDAEVAAMVKAIEQPLTENPDAFCGSIIFQKDGCNMAKRTPVADALDLQLNILDSYGYKVVTVSELMAISQFADCGPTDEAYKYANAMLDKGMCPAYSDNCLHLDRPVTKEEVAMMLFGWPATKQRALENGAGGTAYQYAVKMAKDQAVDLEKIAALKDRTAIFQYLTKI